MTEPSVEQGQWHASDETEDDRGNSIWEVWSGPPEEYRVAVIYDSSTADQIVRDHSSAALVPWTTGSATGSGRVIDKGPYSYASR